MYVARTSQQDAIICTARMRSDIYVTVGRPSVCLSVPAFGRCGGFAAVGPAGRRYRSIAARAALSSIPAAARRAAANAGSATLSAGVANLFCSLAVLDPRVGHAMDVLSLFIPVLCHSD